MKTSIAILLAACVFCSCRTTNLVYLSVLEPAPVTLPQDIKTVVVINRSPASRQNKILDAIDKVVTLEGPNLDKAGAEASVDGLSDELARNQRFTAVKLTGEPIPTNTAPGFFPAPLAWTEVEKVCAQNNADAIFALELFDTDSKISYAMNQVPLKTPLGSIPAIEHQASMQTLVKTGWRIYDPRGRNILDEYAFDKVLQFSARGINPVEAAAALVNRKEAVQQAGYQNGHAYAQRILPYWIRVYRDYYVRGTGNFTIACRMARTGNWKDAETLWYQETSNSKPRLAGRACYNMAIINEINGNLDKAIEWAQKAYEKYNNRLALGYVNLLKNRKYNNTLLQEQQRL